MNVVVATGVRPSLQQASIVVALARAWRHARVGVVGAGRTSSSPAIGMLVFGCDQLADARNDNVLNRQSIGFHDRYIRN